MRETMLLFVVLACFVISTEVFAQNNVVFDNGTISFAPVPTSTGSFSPVTYDDRGLGGYYAMANGFVDVVRSGSLPYDELIIPQLIAVNQALINPNTSPYEPNVQELTQTFLTWYAGIIAVTVLGFVLAFCMPLACLIVCCCRLCNQCGGNLSWSVEEEEKEKKKRICCIVLLAFALIFLALVFVGMVFAFLTNEAVQDTVENVVPTVLNTLDNVGAFTTDALNEASFLVVDQLNFTLNLVVNEATDLNSSIVQPLIQMNRPQVDSLLNGILSINDSLNSVSAALDDIVDNVTALNLTAGNISEQVDIMREQLTNLTTECMNSMLNMAGACAAIPDPSSIQSVDVSSQVNQVLSEIDNFRQSLSLGQNLTEIVNLINGTINDIPSLVQDAVGNQTDSIRETVMPAVNGISQGLEGAKTAVNSIFNDSDPNSILSQIRNVYVPQYVLNEDIPYSLNRLSLGRYIVGVLFCIVALLVIVAVCVGLICGVAGFNKHRLPYERTSLSNCGGICLLVSAALIFVAGFILLILAAIMFPFGSTLRKFCLAVQDPEYEVYGRILDNGEIWGNPPLGSLVSRVTGDPAYSSLDVSIQNTLRNCERNTPLYSALNGDEVLNSVNISIQGQSVNLGQLVMDPISILDVFNISISSLTGQLDTALDGIDLTGIIPRDTIDQLSANLPNVSAFDFSSEIATLRNSIMDANTSLTDAQMNVTTLRNSANMTPNADGVVNQTNAILMTIDTTQNLLNTASNQVDDLEASIGRAQMVGDDAVNVTRVQVNQSLADAETLVTAFTDSLFVIVNGTVNNTVGYVTQYGNYILNALRNDALRCGPLSNIYVGTMNLVCRQTVNSMNGFWFSMGWCALFFIPLVAFVIALSKHFRRHRDVDEILRNAEYAENGYQLETYYNPSVANTMVNSNQQPMGTEGNFTKAKFDDSYPLFEDPRSGAGQTDDYWISNQNGEM